MKVDRKEMENIALAEAAPEAPRLDLYGGIHKALRAMLAEAMLAAGRLDADDRDDVQRVRGQVLGMLDACASHLAHENEFVHPAIEARVPGASVVAAHDHQEHGQAFVALRAAADALLAPNAAARAAAAQSLYRQLALFVAHNLTHMHVEETAHNAALWDHYSDDELMGIHDAILAAIPPAEMMGILRWMVPAMNPAERMGMLSGMRQQAPAEAFAAAIETVRPQLRDDEWDKLARGLGLRG